MARAFKSVPLVRPKYGSVCRGGKAGCLFVGSHARHRFLRWAFRHAALRPAAAARGPGHPFFFFVGGVFCMGFICWSRGALGLACLLASASATVHAQAAWPDRPVRVIVP